MSSVKVADGSAAETLYKRIDTNGADGGLAQVLQLTRVHEKIVNYLTTEEAFESLTDFVRPFGDLEATKRHEEFKLLVEKAGVDTAARRELGRLKTAWECGRDALLHAAQGGASLTNAGHPTDWEDPLLDREQEDMDDTWTNVYHFVLEAHIQPGEPLQNRIYREFRRWAMSVTEVGKMKSFLMEKAPAKKITGEMAGLTFTNEVPAEFAPAGTVGYYWGLRTLAGAWAKAGCYEVESKLRQGTKVLMMPFDVAVNYADRALRVVSTCGIAQSEQLGWLERKDRTTRSVMAAYVRQKYPAQEALMLALQETNCDWTVVKGNEVMGAHHTALHDDQELSSWGQPSQRRRGGKGLRASGGGFSARVKRSIIKTPGGKGRDGGKGKPQPKVTTRDDANKKICGAFNTPRGCPHGEAQCPQWGRHVCGVVDKNGRICESRDHGAASHFKR